MMKKTLLCWNYERKSWITQFEKILEEGGYVFINFYCKDLEQANSTTERVLYWNDFRSVDDLIDQVDPSQVVFMGLDSPYSFLLNYACKSRRIPTYFLQHGIFHSLSAYLYEEERMRKIARNGEKVVTAVTPVRFKRNNRFFLSSYRIQRTALYFDLLSFIIAKKFMHSVQRALQAVAGKRLHADVYIVYTRYLSRIFQERDQVPGHKMVEIGNGEANSLVNNVRSRPDYSFTDGEYFLFIDEAFTGSEKFLLPPIVSFEEHNRFLKTLSDYAQRSGKRLKVKLHPFSYGEPRFLNDENIDFLEEADLTDLIAQSCGIFGFTSTLLIPAIFVKRACLFKLNDFSDIHRALTAINYCSVLNFHHFSTQDITFNDELTEIQASEFIKHFLFKLDDKCDERLQLILRSNQ